MKVQIYVNGNLLQNRLRVYRMRRADEGIVVSAYNSY